MSQSAVYPINPQAAHRIADEAEALQVAEQVAAILLEQDAERDRIALPTPCRKPAAKTCRTFRRPSAVTATVM